VLYKRDESRQRKVLNVEKAQDVFGGILLIQVVLVLVGQGH